MNNVYVSNFSNNLAIQIRIGKIYYGKSESDKKIIELILMNNDP